MRSTLRVGLMVGVTAAAIASAYPMLAGCAATGSTGLRGNNNVVLVNDSPRTIVIVNIRATGASEWGGDWLGASVIPPGNQFTFSLAMGTFDIRGIGEGTVLFERHALTVNGPTAVTVSSLMNAAATSGGQAGTQSGAQNTGGGAASTMGGSLYGN